MRRTIFYNVDLILLDFGIVVGYYARKIQESLRKFFDLMEEEFEEAFRKENDLYD